MSADSCLLNRRGRDSPPASSGSRLATGTLPSAIRFGATSVRERLSLQTRGMPGTLSRCPQDSVAGRRNLPSGKGRLRLRSVRAGSLDCVCSFFAGAPGGFDPLPETFPDLMPNPFAKRITKTEYGFVDQAYIDRTRDPRPIRDDSRYRLGIEPASGCSAKSFAKFDGGCIRVDVHRNGEMRRGNFFDASRNELHAVGSRQRDEVIGFPDERRRLVGSTCQGFNSQQDHRNAKLLRLDNPFPHILVSTHQVGCAHRPVSRKDDEISHDARIYSLLAVSCQAA